MNLETNSVKIIGEIVSEPTYCHTTYDEKFYNFKVKTTRKSETDDTVSVLISEKIMKGITVGNTVEINGQIRTYNQVDNGAKKLLIYVFVLSIKTVEDTESVNTVSLNGFICKDPVYRTTPFGREITDLLVAVNRSYHKSDYIPCIAWGRNAVYCRDFAVGQQIEITGRLQSREYSKKLPNGEVVVKTAYEVSIINIKTVEEN